MLFLLLCATMIVVYDSSEIRIHGGRGAAVAGANGSGGGGG